MEKLLSAPRNPGQATDPTVTYVPPSGGKGVWLWRGLIIAALALIAALTVYGLMNWLK
jgi:hypothetical protein